MNRALKPVALTAAALLSALALAACGSDTNPYGGPMLSPNGGVATPAGQTPSGAGSTNSPDPYAPDPYAPEPYLGPEQPTVPTTPEPVDPYSGVTPGNEYVPTDPPAASPTPGYDDPSE